MIWVILSTLFAFIMAITMVVYRLKSGEKPITARRIIMPPLFMSTGACMFFIPALKISWLQVLEAFLMGMIFSVFLIKTSHFKIDHQTIYLIPSKAFAYILVGLLIVRIILKLIISTHISLAETSGMFFILAFSMILNWRINMLIKYKKIRMKLSSN